MSTVREHLAEHHRVAAEHHTRLAKLHHDRAENCTGDDCDFHKAMGDVHAEHAEHHLECCKSCAKSSGDELDKSTRGISAVNLYPERGGVRAVPRTGAPALETEKIPESMRDLVKTEG